ncbi:MAG TPA: PAS domain-containing sensor histidine kinase [Micropepsaceae bacterium]|nr:PAS domain-containing sensor histidine kinase [Micropepsaceae bacterium]
MHKLLLRQLRTAAKSDSKEVDLLAFSAIVDQTYAEFDRERRLNDRAATLMEEELKAANAQAKREHDAVLAAILDNASEGMLVIGQGGSVAIANAAAEKQFGARPGGLAGLSIGQLLGAEADQVAQGEYPAGGLPDLSGTTLDGRVFPVEFTCTDLEMADGQRQLWMVRDISERMRAQREIMESRMRFQDFAEASSDCFWEMDHTLCHVEVSSAAESDLVTRLPSLLTPGPEGRVPPGVAEDGWRSLRQYLSARQRFRLRLDLKGDDGETLYVSVSGKPAVDHDGHFTGYRGTARDVTREMVAREAARRAERRLIEAMDAAPCAVALVDSQLHLVSGNLALRTLASAKEKRLPFGRAFCPFLTTSLNVEAISPEILRRLVDTGEMREIEIGGSWYLVAACGLSDGGMVLTFSDVSALKERERELAEAKLSAESASRLKSQFLATMSHELRTPLNAILGFSEVIRDGVFGRTASAAEKYAEYAGSIHVSGRHLLALISEILDLSKIEAGSYVLDVRTIDLREMVQGALTIISPAAAKAGVELRSIFPSADVRFTADERAVRQIAINLLANAVKFTPRGGRVTVEVNAADSMVEFAVSDTGIGIAQEHIPTVFEPFRQVDSSIRRRHEGTGLGLAITKRLVELHGGTITLDSELAVGTRVKVTLPGRLADVDFAATKGAAA